MIYLDYAATTPCLYNAPNDNTSWGNSASSYELGIKAASMEEKARDKIAEKLNCDSKQIIFTSGGTEANNLAIFGASIHYFSKNVKFFIAMSPIAHHSMIETQYAIERLGGKILWLKVNERGQIDKEHLEELLTSVPISMVAVDWVNNEIGTIQDVKNIGNIVHKNGALFMVDAVQAFPHMRIDLSYYSEIDFLSISAHKIYGPKGVGALFVRDKAANLSPVIIGGHQEEGYRGGTKNSQLIYSFGKAVEELHNNYLSLLSASLLKTYLIDQLKEEHVDFELNSPAFGAVDAIINLDVKVDSATLVSMLSIDGICVSTGAACGGSFANSHVIKAIDKNPETALRISFGHDTTREEIKTFVQALKKRIDELKGMTE